jgi:hypothetical protein
VLIVTVVGCAGPVPPHQTGWVAIGSGDCVGGDIDSTVGSGVPEPDICTTTGLLAVCWDQVQFVNPLNGSAWCTYKNVASDNACTGGPNPGFFYVCER